MFFVTVAPLKAAPVFAALTRHHAVAERCRIAGGILLMLVAIQMVFGTEGGLFVQGLPDSLFR